MSEASRGNSINAIYELQDKFRNEYRKGDSSEEKAALVRNSLFEALCSLYKKGFVNDQGRRTKAPCLDQQEMRDKIAEHLKQHWTRFLPFVSSDTMLAIELQINAVRQAMREPLAKLDGKALAEYYAKLIKIGAGGSSASGGQLELLVAADLFGKTIIEHGGLATVDDPDIAHRSRKYEPWSIRAILDSSTWSVVLVRPARNFVGKSSGDELKKKAREAAEAAANAAQAGGANQPEIRKQAYQAAALAAAEADIAVVKMDISESELDFANKRRLDQNRNVRARARLTRSMFEHDFLGTLFPAAAPAAAAAAAGAAADEASILYSDFAVAKRMEIEESVKGKICSFGLMEGEPAEPRVSFATPLRFATEMLIARYGRNRECNMQSLEDAIRIGSVEDAASLLRRMQVRWGHDETVNVLKLAADGGHAAIARLVLDAARCSARGDSELVGHVSMARYTAAKHAARIGQADVLDCLLINFDATLAVCEVYWDDAGAGAPSSAHNANTHADQVQQCLLSGCSQAHVSVVDVLLNKHSADPVGMDDDGRALTDGMTPVEATTRAVTRTRGDERRLEETRADRESVLSMLLKGIKGRFAVANGSQSARNQRRWMLQSVLPDAVDSFTYTANYQAILMLADFVRELADLNVQDANIADFAGRALVKVAGNSRTLFQVLERALTLLLYLSPSDEAKRIARDAAIQQMPFRGDNSVVTLLS